jgi:secreted Zn-dependent insulinase-like peptidase
MGVKVAVQSVLDDQHVHGRMEAFLDSVEQLLEDLSTSDFSTHKEALAVKKLDPPKKLSEQGNIWWDEIMTQQHFFDRNEKQVAHMRKNVTLDDVKGFYRDYIHKEGSKRRFLCVHVIPWQASATVRQTMLRNNITN